MDTDFMDITDFSWTFSRARLWIILLRAEQGRTWGCRLPN